MGSLFADTPEDGEIRDAVRKVATREIPKFQNDSYYNTVPRELFSILGENGFTALGLPEEYGGVPGSPVTFSILMEELAAVDLGPAIFTSVHGMICGIINRNGSKEQKNRFLPKMAKGELLGAFGLTEPTAGSDASALKTSARKVSGGYNLTGEKCYITSAGFADVYVIFAKTSDSSDPSKSITAFLVEAGTTGLTISKPERKMGCELSPIASLTMTDLFVPESNVIGEVGEGYKVALSGLSGGRINISACANGLSRTALELASSHLKERSQFGRKLIEFQGLQFMLADMRMLYEASRLLTKSAAKELHETGESRIGSSIAKCFATDSAMKITTDAVQLLGGAGYIKDYSVERLMRDAKMLQIVEGTNQIQRLVIARDMGA